MEPCYNLHIEQDEGVYVLSLKDIRQKVNAALDGYAVKSVVLFGSYAAGEQNEHSDVDLIVEFETEAISLLTLSALRQRLEDELGVSVDLIHGPIPESSFLDIEKTVTIYAA